MVADLSEREAIIFDRLMKNGAVSVAEMGVELEVSDVTIRSDFANLEALGLLTRTHGGAVPSIHPHIFERQELNTEEKHRIAQAAANMVQDGDAIMIEAGTTTSLVPRYLSGKRHVLIITNSILAFSSARVNPLLRITLTGGEFRNTTESFVGSVALEAISRFNVKYAFVGTDGFSLKSGITTHLVEGGDVISAMRKQAQNLVLLADSAKYGKVGVVSILPLKKLDTIITDAKFDTSIKEEIEEQNIQVITC